MTWRTKSTSSEITEQLGQRLGKALKGSETIELVSDLGGGKTTFVRGLAKGAGTEDVVSSPTFTISQMYAAERFVIHHFDFYRLEDPGFLSADIAETVDDPKAVVVVEWGEAVRHVLPDERLTISIKQTPDGARELEFLAHKNLAYLLEVLK